MEASVKFKEFPEYIRENKIFVFVSTFLEEKRKEENFPYYLFLINVFFIHISIRRKTRQKRNFLAFLDKFIDVSYTTELIMRMVSLILIISESVIYFSSFLKKIPIKKY